MAVFDTMRYIKSDVSTVCVGLAASMGAFILASGQKVSLLSCPIDIIIGQFIVRCNFRIRVRGQYAGDHVL